MVFDFYLIYWFFCCDYSDCYVVYELLFHILTVICNILIIMLQYDYYVTYRLFCQILRPYLLVKFHSEIKSSLSMVKTVYTFSPEWNFSPGWTNACVKKTGMRFYPGMKKKKMCKHFLLGWNLTISMFLLTFWRIYSICFPTLTCLNKMKVRNVYYRAFL